MTATWPPTLGALAGLGFPVPNYEDLYPDEYPLGGNWTDATPYIREQQGMKITRGRQNESATISPSQCALTVDNRDYRFSIRNPAGPWYGLIGQNTPFRVSVPNSLTGGGTYLRMEDDTSSSASCPDSAGLQITGTLDIRIDCQLSGYQKAALMAKLGAVAQSWALEMNADGTLSLYWQTGSGQSSANSTVPLPALGRLAVRAVLNPTGQTVTFYTAPGMAGSWTQLGTTIATGATTLAAGAGQPVTVGFAGNAAQGLTGQVYEARIYSGATLEAGPVFSGQAAGTTSFTDGQGNLWTLAGTAEISDRLYRYHGELSSLPKNADPSQRNVYSNATASGIMRRLQQQQTPTQSAMYRAYVRAPASIQLAGYWPMEDDATSTSLASGLPGGVPMAFTGTPALASNSDFVCSAPLPVPGTTAATFTAVIPSGAGVEWTANVVRFLLEIPAAGDTNETAIATISTTGEVATMYLVYTTAGNGSLTLTGAPASSIGTLFDTGAIAWGINGQKVRVSIELNPAAATIVTVLPGEEGLTYSVSYASTIGEVTSVTLNLGIFGSPGNGFTQSVYGHLSVQGYQDSVFDFANQPLNAWHGETAGNRFLRLCGEEGYRCRIWGFPAASTEMGYQTLETIAQLLQECEYTDMGMMFEPRTCLGLGYVTRTGLYNQAVACTANYAAQQVTQGFSSSSDDQLAVNDVTISSLDSSSARQVLESGPMSILNPPAGIGRVDTQVQVNAGNDSDLPDLANWFLHVRSVNDDRYPSIPFNLARSVTGGVVSPAAAPLLDIGDYLQITNTPDWVPPGPARQLCAGFAETLGPAAVWMIGVNGIPESPYEVAQEGISHAGAASSTLKTSISSPATSFQSGAGSDTWSVSAGDYPVDILMAGERMTVTAVSGASAPQTFTVTRSVNGVVAAQAIGASFDLFTVPVAGL